MKSAITIIEKIASNILIALYQPFWFAVISSVLILFFYMFCYDPQGVGKGWKIAVKAWIKKFKEELSTNILYSATIGIGMIYVVSIISNTIINLILGGSSNDSANQLLFESYLNKDLIFMFIQSVILAPVLEELLFRGLIFRSLRSINRNLAFFASAFLFGFLHIYSALFAGDLTQLVYLLSYGGMGFVFTYTYEKRKTICVPMLIHMINNLVAVLVLVLA